ncbi:MAG: pyridoxamine 5'-phosphate oxidase family protein [Clostridia bacterium]|nr:pyridoxamine 5'-phosphate oxidase family protein [Clostridia bacterium]
MFRELTRKNKQLSAEDCIHILEEEKRGVLSVNGDDGYPYGMPMNHWYNKEDGKIYFHCGNVGHRLDALKRDGRVSFCVYDQGYRVLGKWPLHIKSVIVFGRIEILNEPSAIADITMKLSHKFTQDDAYIRAEIEQHVHRTLLLALTPEHICGKLVEES